MMSFDLHGELEQHGLTETEIDVFVSVLGVLDDELYERLGIKQVSLHVAQWYEVALSYFQFLDETELQAQYSVHHKLLNKISSGESRVFSGVAIDGSLFSPLFDVAPKKSDDFLKDRDFGRFIFFQVMRYSINAQSHRNLSELINKFGTRFLKKQDIVVYKGNISNADINDSVFPEMINELMEFMEDYTYVQADKFLDASVISIEQNVDDGYPNEQLITLPPCEVEPDTNLELPGFESDNKETPLKVYPIPKRQTDYQAHQRHEDQALNLPWQSYSLSLDEKRSLITELKLDISAQIPEAIFYLLMITMAKEADDVFSTPIYWDSVITEYGIYPKLNIIALKHIQLKNQYTADPHNTFLHTHSDLVLIPIPKLISDCLESLDPKLSSKYVFELIEPQTFDPAYRNNLKRRSGISRRTLSDKAMQYLLFSSIAELSDPVTASLIFGVDKFNNPISLYYRSLSMKEGAELAQKGLKKVGLESSIELIQSQDHIGSQLAVDRTVFADRVGKLRQQIITGTANVSNISQFNDFALYTALIFMLNGLTRRTNHLFFSSNTISTSKRLLLICDKYTEAYSAVRLLPLTKIASSQISHYQRALKFFATKLAKKDRVSFEALTSHYRSHKNNSIPMVCMVRNGELSPISTKDVIDWLAIEIPENFPRHLVTSSLPSHIQPYIQVFLGHYNQKQHPHDPFSLFTPSFSDECYLALEATMKSLGLLAIPISEIRGDIGKINGLSVFPREYYPDNWLERENRNVVTIRQLKKLLPTDLFYEVDFTKVNEQFDNLLGDIKNDTTINESLAKKYLDDWKNYFNRTETPTLRHRYINEKIHVNTSLRLLEHDQMLNFLREVYLDYVSDNNNLTQNIGLKLFLGICLFQPDCAKRIHQDKPTILSLHIINKTLFSRYFDKDGVEQSYPLNYLAAGILLKHELSIRTLTINWEKKYKVYGSFIDIVKRKWTLPYTVKSISTLNKFVIFCIRHSVLTHSALTKTDGNHFSLASTHFPLKEISRLVLPFNQFQRNKLQVPHPQASIAMYHYQKRSNESLTKAEELLIYQQLHGLFNKTKLKGDKLAAEFREQWATCFNMSSTDVSDLMEQSMCLSQYIFALAWYMHDYCTRLKDDGEPYEATSIYTKISTLNTALQRICSFDSHGKDIGFLKLDEESYIELYREALGETDKENKQDLAIKLKDFHDRVSRNFFIEDIDWDAYIPELNNTFKPKGIARAMSPQEFKLSFDHLQNVPGFTDYERCVHLVVLILGYRVGLRKREVRNLKYYDIDVTSWVVEIASSRYAATKSKNSPRRICIKHYLSDEEKQLLSDVVHFSKVNRQLHPSQLLFGSQSDNPHLDIELVFHNVMSVLKVVTGNEKFRFYDLRHNFINFNLLILSDVKNDVRYKSVLTSWARTKDLDSFSQSISKNLLGRIPDHGATLTLGFAKFMGHSIHTQREYYQHCLHVIGEVQANMLVNKHLSSRYRKKLHINESARYVQNYCKQVELELAKMASKPGPFNHQVKYLNLLVGGDSAEYQRIQYRCLVIYDLIYHIQQLSDCAVKHHVDIDALKAFVGRIEHFVIQTSHLGLPINWNRLQNLNSNPGLIVRFSRHLYAPSFRDLLGRLITLSINDKKILDNFIELWLSRADGHTLTISDPEVGTVERFAEIINLSVFETDAILSNKLNLMGKNIKFKRAGAQKYCMEKLSLALGLIYAVTS